MAAPHYTA